MSNEKLVSDTFCSKIAHMVDQTSSSRVLLLSVVIGLMAGCHQARSNARPKSAKQVSEPSNEARPRPGENAGAASQPSNWPADTAVLAFGYRLEKNYGKGLVAVRLQSGDKIRPVTLTEHPVTWCAADHRLAVVWFVEEAVGKAPVLSLLDLETGRVRRAVEQVPSFRYAYPDHLAIVYPDGALNPLAEYHFRVGMRLVLSTTPRVEVKIGCDGDNVYYCYKDAGKWDPKHPEKGLNEELAKEVAAIRRARPNLPLLRELFTRSKGRPAWRTAPANKTRVAGVSRNHCTEEPSECGMSTQIPGTRHRLVITGNGRGDFLHRYHQIYDPARKRFIHPGRQGNAAFSPGPFTPVHESSVNYLQVSPSGRYLLTGDGDLVSLKRGRLFNASAACGWSGRGWALSTLR